MLGTRYRCIAIVILLFATLAYSQEPACLVKDGKSAYRIVVAPTASASERHAAEDIQTHFKACTGVELPIVEQAEDGVAAIVLGCGSLARKLGVDPKPEELGEQGYTMRTVAPNLVIAGTPAAGTLYGAYDFLETCLGVRWYAPGVTKTPKIKELALPQIDKTVRPAFAWHTTSYEWPGGDADFRAHQRDNAGGGGADNPQGIQYAFDGTCHSYFRYVNPSEFFDSHPEYFSEIGGIRRREETQLCLTNPEVLDIVTERMLKRMAEQPGVRQHNFSQMDWYNYCQCPRCQEINEKYKSMGGTQFWFVNQLAERTSKVYPDKLVGTLAYMYTEEPPAGLTMHPNVAVWLCHMFPSCDSHSIETCPLNADYKRRALAWSKICSHLYIWHYIVDFAHYYNPFPNFDALASDLKFYKSVGVEGIFLQAMGHGGGGGEFSLLRPYYGMKLLWDPNRDADAIMRDFLDGYYAAAAGPIYDYIRLLQKKVADDNIHMHLYTNPAQGYLTDDIMQHSLALFDRAEAAVKDDAELLERVRVARMPLTYARLFPRSGCAVENGQLRFPGGFATAAEAQEMIARMKKHGFQTLRERSGDPSQLMMFCYAFQTPLPVITIANAALSVDVVPFLGGRALRMTDRASGQCATAWNVARSLFFPFEGGEETRLNGIYDLDLSANFGQYQIKAKTDSSLTLTTKATTGMEFERTFTLDPDRPVLTIATAMTNTTDKPQEARMRSHLELDLGELAKTRVQFTSRSGEKIERDMPPIIAGLREGEHYMDRAAPNGTWTFTGTKGLRVTQTFDNDAMDFTWLYAYPDYLNELEVELWAKPIPLDPGKTAVLRHSIEVTAAKP